MLLSGVRPIWLRVLWESWAPARAALSQISPLRSHSWPQGLNIERELTAWQFREKNRGWRTQRRERKINSDNTPKVYCTYGEERNIIKTSRESVRVQQGMFCNPDLHSGLRWFKEHGWGRLWPCYPSVLSGPRLERLSRSQQQQQQHDNLCTKLQKEGQSHWLQGDISLRNLVLLYVYYNNGL